MLTLTLQRTTRARSSRSILSRALQARAVARERKALANLDDAILKDIGISRTDAIRESERSAWDAPRHWMK